MAKNDSQKFDYVLDFRGTISAISLLEMSCRFRKMQINQVLELIADDKDMIGDVFKVLPKASYEKQVTKEGSVTRIRIKKIKQEES
jgi:TusA-related sulfurtransferase